jgi:soluble lytic murein transglycosylase-like protein
MRWNRERDFDNEVRIASLSTSVPFPLIKAVIAAESAFNPRAIRTEQPRPSLPPTPDFPAGGDASLGLMQLLIRTARGLGYTGTMEGLYDPLTNVGLGARLLRQNLDRAGGRVADAISAYNGGFRPSLGFGSKLPSGQYGNQDYVSRVLGYYDYFLLQVPSPATSDPYSPGPYAPGPGGAVPSGAVPFRLVAYLADRWRALAAWWRRL